VHLYDPVERNDVIEVLLGKERRGEELVKCHTESRSNIPSKSNMRDIYL
jgi:hypothetical protein